MQKPNFLKHLAEQLTDILPTHVHELKKDFEKNCHSLLKNTFAKLDLVSREEFDIQTKVLGRTRKKLEDLEKELNSLEKALHKKRDKKNE